MIYRTYQCMECSQYFEVRHDSGDEGDPSCPVCDDIVMQWRPQKFNIASGKAKVADMARDMIAEDYGVTDMNDTREGEQSFKPPPKSKELVEAEGRMENAIKQEISKVETTDPKVQQAIKGFYGGGGVSSVVDVPTSMANARVGPEAYTPQHNPISMIHRAGKAGKLPPIKPSRL